MAMLPTLLYRWSMLRQSLDSPAAKPLPERDRVLPGVDVVVLTVIEAEMATPLTVKKALPASPLFAPVAVRV